MLNKLINFKNFMNIFVRKNKSKAERQKYKLKKCIWFIVKMSDNRESESPEKGPKNDYNPSQIYGCVIAEQTMSLATDTENAPAKITSDQSPASISQQTKLYLAGEWVNLPSVLITDVQKKFSYIYMQLFFSPKFFTRLYQRNHFCHYHKHLRSISRFIPKNIY